VLYYRKPDKVGKAFAISSIVFFTVMVILEVFVFAVPFFRDQLNTRDPMYLPQKLIMLVVGFVLYIIFTRIAYRKSISTFEKLDF
jgi:fucose 4-O-acetylase-like acetyltransferase